MFHKAAVDILWLGSLPTIILGDTVNIMWLGGVIPQYYRVYPPSPLISHPLPTIKSMQKMVNWSCVEHGLKVTKQLRHPHLGTKGDVGWGYPLLGFYCRVGSRSYQGHFRVKSAIILNKNIFLQFPYVFVAKECSTRLQLTYCGWEAFQQCKMRSIGFL